jgi:hypothetical protein
VQDAWEESVLGSRALPLTVILIIIIYNILRLFYNSQYNASRGLGAPGVLCYGAPSTHPVRSLFVTSCNHIIHSVRLSVHEDVTPRGVNPPLQLLLPLNLTIFVTE